MPVATHMIEPNGDYSSLSLPTLTSLWSLGFAVTLILTDGHAIRGLIQGIRMESGYSCGQRPRHFLVTLQATGQKPDDTTTPIDIYFRTY